MTAVTNALRRMAEYWYYAVRRVRLTLGGLRRSGLAAVPNSGATSARPTASSGRSVDSRSNIGTPWPAFDRRRSVVTRFGEAERSAPRARPERRDSRPGAGARGRDNGIMTVATLFMCVWLANSQAAATDDARQGPRRDVLDVVVFYAAAPRDLDRYPVRVRQELQRFLALARAYRPRSRPARLGSEMRMVLAAREGYERKLVAGASGTDPSRLAQEYVDALRPCYEWEGFHDCPAHEALFAEQHLRERPDTPFRDVLRVLAAHRWLCAAEGYEYEQKPADARRARRAYEQALEVAMGSRSALMKAAAAELKTNGRCHATDPFQKIRSTHPGGEFAAQ